ncbi:MAG TPA: site-specific DNA-methyltransferase [Candidatus Wunengus sp. YC60]|uniref:site-specific DNA-methyltransferase n=1 Tax=Candidatus Wunengus sp. YC60 TaxID=3367697 RepID=UPI004028FD05
MGRKRLEPRTTDAAAVSSYKHKDKRKRIPTQEESVKLSAREKQPIKRRYDYDPSLDPQLVWTGKKESGSELSVSTVPIYVQEKIAPEAIIARLKQGAKDEMQLTLFGETTQQQFDKSVEFYKHEDNWQNRMILGDSLLVMNSLLEKEGMRGKVQTIYIDPPYGIKFGSNWQVSTRKHDVKDNKIDDFIRQPEQVKAFRDTWELGIHSYLSYLRDRLIIARELLNESGSCFVQINDENVHLLRIIMDEVFGSENFANLITFKKTNPLGASGLGVVSDYLLWYARDIKNYKFRRILLEKKLGVGGATGYSWVELPNGERRRMSRDEFREIEKLPKDWKIFAPTKLTAAGLTPSCVYSFEYEGETFTPRPGSSWRTNQVGMEQIIKLKRLVKMGDSIYQVMYFDDYPVTELTNLWDDTRGEMDKSYVVQTATNVIERCLIMTTDPGDLVFDPTCGSGTTAYVAEQWGRRWITTDTSRVALALARTRLMTAKFSYYKLKEDNNVRAGFEYKTVPHVTLKSLANSEESEQEMLYDQPFEERGKLRVSGPFTVESLSPHRVSDAQEMVSSERFVQTVVANLLIAGVQTGEKGARVEFVNLDILPGGPEIQASGEYKTTQGLKKVAVAIGPEFGSVDDDFIRDAAKVAKKFADLLIVAATSFEASAFSDFSEVEKLRIMKVKINPDLSMGDLLKKTGSGNLFLAFGEPDVKVKQIKEGIIVEIVGVDIYDPVKSEIRSSGSGDPEHEIAAWFIDTNYSGEAFFVTHAYFLGADKPYEKLKKALKADIKEDAWDDLYSTISRPFSKPKTGKIAVKVINHYGDEVMKVINL